MEVSILFVGGLPPSVTDEALQDAFKPVRRLPERYITTRCDRRQAALDASQSCDQQLPLVGSRGRSKSPRTAKRLPRTLTYRPQERPGTIQQSDVLTPCCCPDPL